MLQGFFCGCAPSFIQGSFQRVNKALGLSVGPRVIWGDRDMIDLEGHTKILKIAGRKLCPIDSHWTINYPKSGEQFVEEIERNFCSGISTSKDFEPFQKTINNYYKIIESVYRACKIYIYSGPWSVRFKPRTIFDWGALAAKAQPLQDFTMFSISLSMFGQYI